MRARTWGWLGLVLAAAASCVQILDGDHPYGADPKEEKPVPCSTDANCNDNNPCTTGVCDVAAGTCVFTSLDAVLAPNDAQTPADCKQVRCVAGVSDAEDDLQDVFDDGNDCTEDVCVGGVSENNAVKDGTTCTQDTKMGTCKVGKCLIACVADSDCDDGNACSYDLCNTSTNLCNFTDIDGLPTPGFTQVVGDCQVRICVDGKDTSIPDDSDLPEDNNSCTQNTCVEGDPVFPGEPAGTPCEPNETKVCDGNGACVECIEPSDCVDIEQTECVKRSCVDNKCVSTFPGNETLASAAMQTPSDCKKVVCDGTGGTTIVNDDADVPIDDNACTKDVCTLGVPSNPNEPVGTVCSFGGNDACDGNGACKESNGKTCAAGSECASGFCIDGVCCDNNCGNTCRTCNAASNPGKCVFVPNGADDAPNCSGITVSCNGAGSCRKENGQSCTMNPECRSNFCVDGVCCDTACNTTCVACIGMKTGGLNGTCSPITSATDPDNECPDDRNCNGMGMCTP